MALDYSESSASFEMLTPSINASEQPGSARINEQFASGQVAATKDDLTLGRELMMTEVGSRKINLRVIPMDTPRHTLTKRFSLMKTASKSTIGSITRSLNDICRRLDSEICTISVGPEEIVLKALHAVLAQSPILRAFPKHTRQRNQASCIELPDQNFVVVRRILQYLYGQKLPMATTDSATEIEQLYEIYIMACKLDLDVLQDLIVRSLKDNAKCGMSEILIRAAHRVYEAGQARVPFREFIKYTIQKDIQIEGLGSSKYVRHTVETLLTYGGTLAVDVALAPMDACQQKHHALSDKVREGTVRDAEGQITKLRAANEKWNSKTDPAEVEFADLETHVKQADSDVKPAALQVESAQQRAKNAETDFKNEQARAESAEARVHDLTERTMVAERGLDRLRKKGIDKKDTSKSRNRAKNQPVGSNHTSGPKQPEGQGVQERRNGLEDEGLVAVACESQDSTFEDEMPFDKGDSIANVVSLILAPCGYGWYE